jgi:hypothetical protein
MFDGTSCRTPKSPMSTDEQRIARAHGYPQNGLRYSGCFYGKIKKRISVYGTFVRIDRRNLLYNVQVLAAVGDCVGKRDTELQAGTEGHLHGICTRLLERFLMMI